MLPYLEARLRGQISRWPQAQDWLALQAVNNREALADVLAHPAFRQILPYRAPLTVPESRDFLTAEADFAAQYQKLWQAQVRASLSPLLAVNPLNVQQKHWDARQEQLLSWGEFFPQAPKIDKKLFAKQWLATWSANTLSQRLLALWWPLWCGQLPMTQWTDFESYFTSTLAEALRILRISSGKPLLVLAYFVALSLLFYRLRGQVLPLLAFSSLPTESTVTADKEK